MFFLFRQGFRSGFSIVVVGRVCGSGLSSVFVGREFRSGLSVGFCGRGRCVRSGFSVGSSFGFAVKVFQSGLSGVVWFVVGCVVGGGLSGGLSGRGFVVWFVEFVEQGRLKAFGGVALLLKLFCALQSVEGTQQMTNHIHASTRAKRTNRSLRLTASRASNQINPAHLLTSVTVVSCFRAQGLEMQGFVLGI